MNFTLEVSTMGPGDKCAGVTGFSVSLGSWVQRKITGYYILVIEDIGGNGCVSKS